MDRQNNTIQAEGKGNKKVGLLVSVSVSVVVFVFVFVFGLVLVLL